MSKRHRALSRPHRRQRISVLGAASLALVAASQTSAQTTAQSRAQTVPTPSQGSSGPPVSGSPQSSHDTPLTEVVVTARRREESGQRVPQTVTALSPQLLKQQNIQSIADLTFAAPSLSIASSYTSLNNNFTVRGLPTGVTTYFSDAPCCGAANKPFLDVASAQVLNGPQGTLFGRSSAAGAVLIDPAHPDLRRYSGYVEGDFGNYARAQVTGVVNLPIIADHIALRLAVRSDSVEGYTKEIGTNDRLDGVGDQLYRVGLEVKYGGFDNYAVYEHFNVDESGTSELLGGSSLNNPLYNLPASSGPAYFGALCAQAVSYGFSTNVNSCINQRVNTLHQIQSTLVSETQRLAGGGDAVRYALPSYDGQADFNREEEDSLVNITQYNFDELPFIGKANLRNIFSLDSFSSIIAGLTDGLGGIGEESSFTETNADGGSNQIGNRNVAFLPPRETNYTDEFQVRGDYRSGLFVWAVGNFYSYSDIPQSPGSGVTYKIYGGVFTPNLGYGSADGFQSGQSLGREEAPYTQGTLNLDRIGVHGLSLTGGFRYSWDHGIGKIYPEQINYPSGVVTPMTNALVRTVTDSNGYNYTLSAQEQVTHNLMIYFTQSRAYVPGGINPYNSGTSSAPNYTQTYQPETVLNREAGVKYEFQLGKTLGRINLSGYFDKFNDIVETFVGTNGASSFVYSENAAAASLKGMELEATLIPFDGLEFDGSYNYNDQSYDKWVGQDPFNVAAPGNPLCLPSSPAGTCYLDLSKNPPFLSPVHQAHLTARYVLPLNPMLGKIDVSTTAYAQSRVYYEATANRDLQIKPDDLGAISQAPYAVLNLRSDWRDVLTSGWNVAAFINNATDKVYARGKVAQTITLGFGIANYAAPRMFGFEISRKFGSGA